MNHNIDTKYNTNPSIKVDENAFNNFDNIVNELKTHHVNSIAFECYPGTDYDKLLTNIINKLNPNKVYFVDDYALEEEEILRKFDKYITNDRVFGYMCPFEINSLYKNSFEEMRDTLKKDGLTIFYGFGASLFNCKLNVYLDLTRLEIQKRYQTRLLGNFNSNNINDDPLIKFKRGYFIEWRIADKLKEKVLKDSDYYLDLNEIDKPVMVKTKSLFKALRICATRPFRMTPYFIPGVWGGQWMKEVCNLDKSAPNYAWCFDGVAEENSITFDFNGNYLAVPAINLVLFESKRLLGKEIIRRFGKEFPIRFDFLDTFEGQNLSLQVHPTLEYIKKTFGMKYTQDESYYILDSTPQSKVFIGFKEDINKDDFINDLNVSTTTNHFDVDKYVNSFPVKKHDHILIPAGTIHCSGKDTMVLEISSTPYIFTFKLWDWNRVGLDGKPRPIHIEHGEKVLNFNMKEDIIKKELVNDFTEVYSDQTITITKTGLHKREIIDSYFYDYKGEFIHKKEKTLNMLNLVDGASVTIETKNSKLDVSYAETFVIPACIKKFKVIPRVYKNNKCSLISACIRRSNEKNNN